MQRKYQLGEPLYRQQQYWERRGIYLNRTLLANWIIKGAAWFEPVIRQLKYHAFLEPVLNADETPTCVLKKNGEPVNKKGQMWCRQTDFSHMAAENTSTQDVGLI